MGMSASQARFLGLTARKNNVEFEGQQINQQRTALSNQSANYYNDLLGMSVPIPPSVDDFTKTYYTFEDGALSNTITSLIPSSKNDGTYSVSYLKSFTDDFAVVSASSSVVTRTNIAGDFQYSVGATVLRTLGQVDATPQVGNTITIKGTTYTVQNDGTGYFVEMMQKVKDSAECTADDIANIEYYYYDNATGQITRLYKDETENKFYYEDSNGNPVDTFYVESDLIMALWDGSYTDPEYAVSYVTNVGGTYMKEVWNDELVKQPLTDAQVASITTYSTTTDDPFLKDLTSDQLAALMQEEAEYLSLLQEEFGAGNWMVRYVKDTSTGKNNPFFYKQESLQNETYDANGNSLSSIDCYTIGSKKRTEEIKNREGVKIEQDSTGRYINISFPQYDGDGKVIAGSQMTTYALTTNTATDQDAYTDAMNQYEYEKYQYDQAIQDINSKIEIIQSEDKNLELRLKQLDTEQGAISQEMDAVSKVIEKNIESSFRTFG